MPLGRLQGQTFARECPWECPPGSVPPSILQEDVAGKIPSLKFLAAVALRPHYFMRPLPSTGPAVIADAIELAPLSLETQRAVADARCTEAVWPQSWFWSPV